MMAINEKLQYCDYIVSHMGLSKLQDRHGCPYYLLIIGYMISIGG